MKLRSYVTSSPLRPLWEEWNFMNKIYQENQWLSGTEHTRKYTYYFGIYKETKNQMESNTI